MFLLCQGRVFCELFIYLLNIQESLKLEGLEGSLLTQCVAFHDHDALVVSLLLYYNLLINFSD